MSGYQGLKGAAYFESQPSTVVSVPGIQELRKTCIDSMICKYESLTGSHNLSTLSLWLLILLFIPSPIFIPFLVLARSLLIYIHSIRGIVLRRLRAVTSRGRSCYRSTYKEPRIIRCARTFRSCQLQPD